METRLSGQKDTSNPDRGNRPAGGPLGWVRRAPDELGQGNARLALAAQELLESCEDALACSITLPQKTIDSLKESIAKARGDT